jgi:16S rRNA (guanine527-N7)-methyltransferase
MQTRKPPIEISRRIDRVLEQCSIPPSEGLVDLIRRYIELLEQWNRKVNLTRTQGLEELIQLHFAESFFGAALIQPGEGPILDLGSGAGFPGMAMSLVLPEESYYLVESRVKKAAFLSTVRRELQRNQVTVVHRTLEQCQPSLFPVPPGLLTLRAVGDPVRLAKQSQPLFRRQSRLLFYSTSSQADAIREALPEVEWQRVDRIPWSREKLLLKGRWKS